MATDRNDEREQERLEGAVDQYVSNAHQHSSFDDTTGKKLPPGTGASGGEH